MSECKQFRTKLAYPGEAEGRAGALKVTHAFSESANDGGVILAIELDHLSSQIHTDEQSLLNFAMRVIKEFAL